MSSILMKNMNKLKGLTIQISLIFTIINWLICFICKIYNISNNKYYFKIDF